MSYYLIGGIMWLLYLLPHSLVTLLGKGLGYIFYYVAAERRRVGLINLTLCFPHMPKEERQHIILQHFQHLTTAILEYGILWFAPKAFLKNFIQVEGYEHYLAAQDKAIILLAPHFIGLDMGGLRYSMEHVGASMYSHQKSKGLNRLLLRGRSRFTQPLLFSRQEGVRPIIRALRNKITFYYLPDQDFGPKESIFVPFFGVPAATIEGVSRLARAGNAKVVPAVTRREGNRYILRYYPAWENFPSDDPYADARRMNAFIEARIVEMPAQYFWLHKRFKTRPVGEEPLYTRQSSR
jgi:KDO2-lipid IV(A) lauroyltransferase